MREGSFPEGKAVVFCEGAFGTPNGKTAHGLVRRTRRYEVKSVIDSSASGRDSGTFLDGRPNGIPILSSLAEARDKTGPLSHFVIGLAPDGGRLAPEHRDAVKEAVASGLHVDSGLHDFLSDDAEIASLAERHGVRLRDVRKPPERKELHFFTGKIEEVDSLKIAVLGTDSAIGKRTTAWILVEALNNSGIDAELVGTGQTAWMQGARFGIILDSLINDFVSGEIEHAVWTAWKEAQPAVIVIEGQGSLMNPAYPGGFEILAAGRPDAVVLQHAPMRQEYDGFPGYPLHPLDKQIQAITLISGKPVIAVTINHEQMKPEDVEETCRRIGRETGLPAADLLLQKPDAVMQAILSFYESKQAVSEKQP
jgi:uncharacterized NAD-dependent epimerase/dehydratase family protein